jgi:hypothetical protein
MSDTRVSRRTFLVAGGAAATSLAMGDTLGRRVGDPEAVAGDVSGTVRAEGRFAPECADHTGGGCC